MGLITPSDIRSAEQMRQALGEAFATIRALQAANAALQEDIRQCAQAEDALRESEARFRTIFEESPVAKAIAATDGRFLAVNGSLCDMLGYSPAELTSTSHAAIVHPDDLPASAEGLRALRTGERETFRREMRYAHRDGHAVWADVSAGLLRDPHGNAFHFIMHFQDVTERKRAEQEIQALARFTAENPQPILRLAGDGVILSANQASAAVLQEWGCSVGKRAPDPWPDMIRQVLETARGRSADHSCGSRFYTFRMAPVPEAGYVNLYGSDITDRKQVEDELRRTVADLDRSNQELERFASVASHDLQEPLRMVVSYTQLLAERYGDRLDQNAREFIGFAVDGATRMQRLIRDLLAYSRVTTRGAGLAPTDALVALDAAVTNLRVAIQETGGLVTHEALPAVRADVTQLTQVFQNLIGNALKFHGEAAPRVHVRASRRDGDWMFEVRDNGIGIEPRYFDRIFVIFQRLHPPHRYPGTGIGLALCQRIVERHGGRLWVESAPGRGSTFYFTLKPPEGKLA